MKPFPCSYGLALATVTAMLASSSAAQWPSSASGLFNLKQATINAFAEYVAKTESHNAQTLREGPFLWPEGLPENERAATFSKLRSGQVVMRRLSVKTGGGNLTVPGGMIHDWEGIVFIPGAKIDDVLKILQDYSRHSTYYVPDVTASRIESRNGDHFQVFLQFHRKKVVTVVLNTQHDVTYFRDSPNRAHSRSSATRIAQLEDPGGPHETEKHPGEDDGFLWRMETWWRLEERDRGVYVQNQVVSLTRNIPIGLGWLIEPFITNIPKETLEFTMQATRKAVLAQRDNVLH